MSDNFKAKLKNVKSSLIGSWITLAHPAIAEIMARAGFDWLAVDMEHSVITIREAEELIRVIDLAGVVPLVRLTSNNSDQIKRIMDAGAHGIIVPMVNSAKDAINAVEAIKYPPMGKRGIGLARAQGWGTKFQEYFDWEKQEKRRHLFRLWLSTPDGRPLPQEYGERFHSLEAGQRPVGGILVPGTKLIAPLDA